MSNPLSPEEFWAYFESSGRFPDNSYVAAKGYRSEVQKNAKYSKYLRSFLRKEASRERAKVRERIRVRKPIKAKPDELWETVKDFVRKRDKGCRLIRVLVPFELAQLVANSSGLHTQLDCAHIRPRSTYPELKYDVNNVVLLNRYSHSCLDMRRDPVSGRKIPQEEVDDWWQRILRG
jgi:hypothetical protein